METILRLWEPSSCCTGCPKSKGASLYIQRNWISTILHHWYGWKYPASTGFCLGFLDVFSWFSWKFNIFMMTRPAMKVISRWAFPLHKKHLDLAKPGLLFRGSELRPVGPVGFFLWAPSQSLRMHSLSEAKQLTSPIAKGIAPSNVCRVGGLFSSNYSLFLISRFLVSFIFPEEFGRACHRKVSLQRISVIGTVGWNMLEQIPIWPGVETAKRWCWSFPMAQMKLFASQALQVAPNIQIPAHIKFQGFWFQTWKKCEAFEVWVGEMMDCKNCNNCT